MPANTSNGYPYPLDTEPIANGAAAIQNLANAVDSKLRTTAAGFVSVTFANSATVTAAITFPAGRFTAGPSISVTGGGTSTVYGYAAGGTTVNGVTIGLCHRDANLISTTVTAHWQAISVG